MAEDYFVVLEVPAGRSFKFIEDNADIKNFWGKAANAICSGKAKIVSRRQDTGVSEEVRSHAKEVRSTFKTYILVNMKLGKRVKNDVIFAKAAKCINNNNAAAVIEANDDFQLLAIGA